jgi:uncharacterized protein (DUF697 family)/tellurite resistance protein
MNSIALIPKNSSALVVGTFPICQPPRTMNLPTTEPHPSAEALLAICHFAAFADGEKSESERARLDALARELGESDVSSISRRILMGRLSLDNAVVGLAGQDDRLLAYEMARAICEAGGDLGSEEKEFLGDLRVRLGLGEAQTKTIDTEVDAVALAPVETAGPPPIPADQSGMILRYSILNGALELLPQTMATMAILPLQMKMVWRIGKTFGHELDRSSIKEFIAAAGIGIGSQVIEGFARKLIGGFGKKLGGKLVGRIANEATGSAFSFASTYAIGHLAVKYYSGGRKLGGSELKSLYAPLANEAKQLHARYAPEIQQRARNLDATSIMNLVRGKDAV